MHDEPDTHVLSRYRCRKCRVIYPLPEYVCIGGWYNSNPPGRREEQHEPLQVVKVES